VNRNQLEHLIRNNLPREQVDDLSLLIEQTQAQLSAAILSALPSEFGGIKAAPADTAQIAAAVTRLADLLARDDMGALDVLEEIHPILADALCEKDLKTLTRLIEGFDLENARKLLISVTKPAQP
jgi:hypothetical protein